MNYFDNLAQIIGLCLCIIIIVKTEPALNRMTCKTTFLVRISIWLLLTSAIVSAVNILEGNIPSFEKLVMLLGVASLLFCERRLRILTRTSNRGVLNANIS